MISLRWRFKFHFNGYLSRLRALKEEHLKNKILYARDKIFQANSADSKEKDTLLHEADTYLMEGLTDLYTDIDY